MNTEITDHNATTPAGWVFYDEECTLCRRGAVRLAGLFGRRGFVWLPLQSSDAKAALGSHITSMREQMRLRLISGRIASGVDAWAALFRSVWWLWPVGALLSLPGANQLGRLIYASVARRRHCLGGNCRLELPGEHPHHRHSAFFEMP